MDSTIAALEGWLLKEKSRTATFGLGGDLNKRWFKVERFEWNSAGELALAYYKASTDGRCRGWLYLRDITYIREEGDTMIFCSPARTLRLQAPTRAEHRLWVKGMVKLCPQALTTLEQSKEAVEAQQLLVETAQTTPTSDSGSAQSDRDYGCSTPPSRGAVSSPFASRPQKGSRKESNSTSRPSSKKKTQKHARSFSSAQLGEEEMGNIHSPVRFGSSGEGSNSPARDDTSSSQVSSRSGRGAPRRQSSTLSRGGFFEEDDEDEHKGRPAERNERDDGDDGQRRRSSKARKRSTNQTDRDEVSGGGSEERGGQKRRQERRRGTSSGSCKAAADGAEEVASDAKKGHHRHESPGDSDEQQRNTMRGERHNSSRSSRDASTDRRDLRKDSWARRRGHEEEDEDEEEEEREGRGRQEEEEQREEEEAGGDGSICTRSDRSEGSRGALLTYERSRGGKRTAQRVASRMRKEEDVECEGSTSKDNVEHNDSGTRHGGGRGERGHRQQESRADSPSNSSAMASRRRSVKKDRTEGSRGGDPSAAEASRARRGEDVDISDLAGDGDPLGPEVDEVLLEDAERHGSGLSFEEPPEMRMRQSAQRAADRGGGKKSKSKSKSGGSRGSSSSSSNSSGSARRAPSSAPPKPRQFLEVRQEVESSPTSSNEGSKGLRLAGTTTKARASTESGRQTTSRSGKSREGGVGVTSEEPCPPFVRRRKSIMDELDPALTSSSGPLQLDDGSDEEGDTSIDLEMEKQRRKASAALTALKAAAKEADRHSHHMEQRRAKSGKRGAGGQRQKQHGADQLEGAEEDGEEEGKKRLLREGPKERSSSSSSSRSSSSNSNNRPVQPPRDAPHPKVRGMAADKNFVTDTWDESDGDEGETKAETHAHHRRRSSGGSAPHGVTADSNWLHEDFDV